MNFFFKQKLWFFIAVFFIVINLLTISLLFCPKHYGGLGKHFRDSAKDNDSLSQYENFRRETNHGEKSNRNHFSKMKFLADELNFSEEQRKELMKINEEIETRKDSIYEKHEDLKKLFNQALYAENTQLLDSLIKAISANSESYNRLRIKKANKIKALCTAEQKEKLSTVFNQKNFSNHSQEKRVN